MNPIRPDQREAAAETLAEAFVEDPLLQLLALQRLHRLVGGPQWYLMTIGTRPPRQGEGLGRAVLAAGTTQADLDGLPCYLETSTQRAVDFYLEHGFDVVGRKDIDGHIVFGLVRQPASERDRSAQRGDGQGT